MVVLLNGLEGGEFIAPTVPTFITPRRLGVPTAIPSRPGDGLTRAPRGDSRGFVHRRIIGAVGGFIRGGPLGAVGGFLGGGRQPTPVLPVPVPAITAIPQRAACPPGFFETPAGGCQPTGAPSPLRALIGRRGREVSRAGEFPQPTPEQAALRTRLGREVDPAAGVAVMGRFGAGFEPEVFMTDTRRCGRGAVLAVDGLCYNKRDLRNTERFWPRGRRPLLTGGEVRAISVASSAAKKLERKQKQLMELGLLKRPTRSRRAAPAGHRATLTHDGGSQH